MLLSLSLLLLFVRAMVFFRKAGSMLGRSVSNHISHGISFSEPSIFQAVRWMSSSKLFIGGLSWSTDDSSLREAFNKYGDVADARVIVDRETGRSRGFGFITYSSVEEASAAIQALDQQELHGRSIRVDYANDRTRGFGGGGSYNSGGFGGNYCASSGYNNNDGYGGNYGNGDYGSSSNYNSGVGGYGRVSGPNASNNGYDGGNLSYGGDHQNSGSDNLSSGGGGAGGSSGSSGYDGFGGKTNKEAGVDQGFGDDDSLEGNYADRRS